MSVLKPISNGITSSTTTCRAPGTLVNFLAHFHLAWPDQHLVLGGLEGDFHKGGLPGTLPAALQDGVALHRAIDAYTDSH